MSKRQNRDILSEPYLRSLNKRRQILSKYVFLFYVVEIQMGKLYLSNETIEDQYVQICRVNGEVELLPFQTQHRNVARDSVQTIIRKKGLVADISSRVQVFYFLRILNS